MISVFILTIIIVLWAIFNSSFHLKIFHILSTTILQKSQDMVSVGFLNIPPANAFSLESSIVCCGLVKCRIMQQFSVCVWY